LRRIPFLYCLNKSTFPFLFCLPFYKGGFLLSFLLISCTSDSPVQTDLNTSQNTEESGAIHLFYLSRDGQQIKSEQWSEDFSQLLASAEIPWQISGSAEGGLQSDLADSPVLQSATDQSSFVLRTFIPQPFTGLGPEEDGLSENGSFLYLFKSATGEFREIYSAGGDSVISNFLYIPEESAVYFELIHNSDYSLNRLSLQFPIQPPKILYSGTNEIFRFRFEETERTLYSIIQNGEEIIELSHLQESDTVTLRVAGKIPAFQPTLPASSSNGTCLVCPFLPTSKQNAHSLRIFCNNLPLQDVFIPDKIINSELVEPDNWLVLGSESITLLDSQGKIRHRYCTPEPNLLATDRADFYIRSGDFTLRFKGDNPIPDTLSNELHEKFFDLLGVKKGSTSQKRI
jgi:hypothetical protein